MSSKFNFGKYDEYLKNKKEEGKVMESKEIEKDVKVKLATKEDITKLEDDMEKRIYGMLKPYFKILRYIDKNTQKIAMDKQISACIKDLKKFGYVFKNEKEIQEQMEANYLKGIGFIFSKGEEK